MRRPRTEDEKRRQSEKLRGRKLTDEQRRNISEGRLRHRKSNVERFLKSKTTIKVLGKDRSLSDSEIVALDAWFAVYPVEKSYWWFEQLSIWIERGALDFLSNRQILATERLSETAFVTKWGDDGSDRFKLWRASRGMVWNKDYWKQRGFTDEQADQEVSRRQKKNSTRLNEKFSGFKAGYRANSHRCLEFYKVRGYSESEAAEAVASSQRRDLDYFITRYGQEDGFVKFEESKVRRKETWKQKDRIEHARKTMPRSFNESGHESRAVRMFIEQNDLSRYRCIYGGPDNQFAVEIPNIGVRRYDLAVFDGDDLIIVFEYHGPAHINFSHFDEEIRHERVWDETGKILPYSKTFGEVFDNDWAKKQYIEQTYPHARYIVGWIHDLKNKDFSIETLTRRFQDRISHPVLHDRPN